MDKLEAGDFVKQEYFEFTNYIHIKSFDEAGWAVCDIFEIHEGALDKNKRFDLTGLEKVKTLTPSEALILLAKGFVLFNKEYGYLAKLNSDGLLLYRNLNETNWELCYLSDFSDFTIHALPEGQ